MPAKPKRLPATVRREQILTVATELFARQGFHGTTTRQLAEKAGVKEVILFRLFPSKHDLYWAVIEAQCAKSPGQEGLVAAIAASRNDRELFTTLAVQMLEQTTRDGTLLRLLLFSALEAHELSARFSQTYMTQYYETLAAHIRRRQKEGAYRKVEPVLAARAFLGMVFQYAMARQLFSVPAQDHRQVAETFVEIWLRGMET
jgi:AcrR family transcriptional regulator